MIPVQSIQPYRADREVPSPNHGPRTMPAIRCAVLHATADNGNELGSVQWLTNPLARASAHLLVHRNGTVTRLVPDDRRAWHAGVSEWMDSTDVNSISLGWELANRNDGREQYTDAQYGAIALIAAHYLQQGLPLSAIVSHAEVARPLGRKNDPLGFDFAQFRSEVRALTSPLPMVEVGEPVYSPALNDILYPIGPATDREWWFCTQRQILSLPRIKAGTALSKMPKPPRG